MTQTQPSTDRGPITDKLVPPAPPAPPPRRKNALRWVVLGGVVAFVGVIAFLLVRSANPLGDTRPVEVVQGFAAAIEARDPDKMLSFVEPTIFRREISPEIRSYVEYLRDVRFTNARYELLDNDGETAHVRWTATMKYTFGLGDETRSGERAIDSTFELTNLEGNWYLRSAKLPQ